MIMANFEKLTDAQLEKNLWKLTASLYANKGSSAHRIGRFTGMLLGAVGAGGIAAAIGVTVSVLTAVPFLAVLTAGIVAAGAWVGASAYAACVEEPSTEAKRNKVFAIRAEQQQRRKPQSVAVTATVPAPALRKETAAVTEAKKVPVTVEDAKPQGVLPQQANGRKLREVLAAATSKMREETPLLTDIDKIVDLHEREFGFVFNALAGLPETAGRKFVRENAAYAGSGVAPTALTEIYLADSKKEDVEAILHRRAEDRKVAESGAAVRPDADRKKDYEDLMKQTRLRVSTNEEKIELQFRDQSSHRVAIKKFAAGDFSAARQEIGAWLSRNATEFVALLDAYPATVYKSIGPKPK